MTAGVNEVDIIWLKGWEQLLYYLHTHVSVHTDI